MFKAIKTIETSSTVSSTFIVIPPIVVAEIIVVLGSTLFEQEGDESWARDSRVFQMKAEKCRDQSQGQHFRNRIFACEEIVGLQKDSIFSVTEFKRLRRSGDLLA